MLSWNEIGLEAVAVASFYSLWWCRSLQRRLQDAERTGKDPGHAPKAQTAGLPGSDCCIPEPIDDNATQRVNKDRQAQLLEKMAQSAGDQP